MITVTFWADKQQPPVITEIPEGHDPFAICARAAARLGFKPAEQDDKFEAIMAARKAGSRGSVGGAIGAEETRPHPAVDAGVRDTSMQAFRKMEFTGRLGKQEREIVQHFLKHPTKGFTRNEVSRDTGIRINSCTARINRLIKEPFDVLEEVRQRKCSVTGETCYELRIKR